jgi:hypothetical protein
MSGMNIEYTKKTDVDARLDELKALNFDPFNGMQYILHQTKNLGNSGKIIKSFIQVFRSLSKKSLSKTSKLTLMQKNKNKKSPLC